MSLPVVKTFSDCVDFSKTVLPYTSQIYDLPQQILQSISNPQALKVLYVSTNPLISAFVLSLFLAPLFLVASEINRNYSQVDRFWSILPTLFNAHFVFYAHAAGFPTKRLDTLFLCSAIWSLRLTFNYWRKGGYSVGSEDYRWEVLRNYIHPALFFIFNVAFISLAQCVLLFSITTPTYILLLASRLTGNELQWVDVIFSRGLVTFVLLSFLADQQQWDYQNAKKEYQKTAKVPAKFQRAELDRGFNTSGLWAWSRHPNFLAEQSVWVTLYLWSCWLTQTYYNWTMTGAISYLVLFQASTWFTELITARKYPEYKEYQKAVGKFIPGLSSSSRVKFDSQRGSDRDLKRRE